MTWTRTHNVSVFLKTEVIYFVPLNPTDCLVNSVLGTLAPKLLPVALSHAAAAAEILMSSVDVAFLCAEAGRPSLQDFVNCWK